ncbi:XRE family transcriptional regulator [Erysipelothrix sp. HDW6C]|uniref:XRE family transcriptional regulator n=1 Tax=Erysipelothrix sp. HDW6C TaxID=2714930 RepID=UPI00140C7E00|nr:XRE family transcriptional regulator [Erysipelothrix sp. HDW6C]QIK70440.1 XRE family transcriptional regulator [Erysipelothrix sp. HDW6C]
MAKNTDELFDALAFEGKLNSTLDETLHVMPTLAHIFNELLEAKSLSKREVIDASLLNPTYAYEIFSGKKTNPSRNHILQLTLGMGCTLEETKYVLKHSNVNPLYPKNTRDAIIIYAINHKHDLSETEELLEKHGESYICRE